MQVDTITLAWDRPEDDGGYPISGYVIDRSDVTKGGWATVGRVDDSTHSYRITRLLPGNRYNFRVSAENSVGLGSALETIEAIEMRSQQG